MKKRVIGAVMLALMLVATLVTSAAAAGQPRASAELSSYSATMYANGNGNVSVEFSVSAVGVADEVGVTQIVFQRKNGTSWTNVQTYNSSSSIGMVGTNCLFYTNSKSYAGTTGQQYRAVLTIYARIGTGSTSRSYTTNTVTA